MEYAGRQQQISLFIHQMETNSSTEIEILHDFFPLIRIYKDGRIERFSGEDVLPPTIDPVTGVESQDVKISSQPDVSARLYLPKIAAGQKKLPLLVYFHGGGFVIESAFSATYHNHMNSLASEANVVIVSVNYRRAPEHFLPAAYEDCWSAIKWISSTSIHQHSWLNNYADFNKVYFGGDSAGANLAHQMALKMGNENVEGLNLVGIFLSCPYFWGKEPIGKEACEWKKMLDNLWYFLHPNTTGLDDPLINPATDPKLSSLGCKKVLVIVGEKDVLSNRGWHYKDVLTKTSWDGEIEVVEFEGENHVFNLISPNTENAISMMKMLVSFLNQDGV